jgi:hypothetical protein
MLEVRAIPFECARHPHRPCHCPHCRYWQRWRPC